MQTWFPEGKLNLYRPVLSPFPPPGTTAAEGLLSALLLPLASCLAKKLRATGEFGKSGARHISKCF